MKQNIEKMNQIDNWLIKKKEKLQKKTYLGFS